MVERPSIFISYSRKDEKWKDRLAKHLRVAAQHGSLIIWDDSQIAAGSDWKLEIERAMAGADVAVLLISSDFVTSEFVLNNEIPRLLERRRREGLHVVPVLVRPCDWGAVDWLASMQIYPSGRAISKGSKHDIEEDMAALATEIRSTLQKPKASRPPAIAPRAPLVASAAARPVKAAPSPAPQAPPKRPALKKSPAPIAGRERSLEGVWMKDGGGLFCVRIEGSELRCVYSYKGNQRTGELYDWRISGDVILVRFRWLNSALAGWMHLTAESRDRLTGGWWLAKDTAAEPAAPLVPEYQRSPIALTRTVTIFPQWAVEYFEQRMWEQR